MPRRPEGRKDRSEEGAEPGWFEIWKMSLLCYKRALPKLLVVFLPSSLAVVTLNREADFLINLTIREAFEMGKFPLLSLLSLGLDASKAAILSFSSSVIMVFAVAAGVLIFLGTRGNSSEAQRDARKFKNLGSELSETAMKFHRVLGVTAVWSVAFIIGLILFVVPGVLLFLKLCMVLPAVMAEGKKVREAISRSNELSRGRLRKLFVVLFPYLVFYFAGTSWVSSAASRLPGLFGLLVSSVAVGLATALGSGLIASSYITLLAKKTVK